jgi:hypothetical protein
MTFVTLARSSGMTNDKFQEFEEFEEFEDEGTAKLQK